jgi:hypothetical protein
LVEGLLAGVEDGEHGETFPATGARWLPGGDAFEEMGALPP